MELEQNALHIVKIATIADYGDESKTEAYQYVKERMGPGKGNISIVKYEIKKRAMVCKKKCKIVNAEARNHKKVPISRVWLSKRLFPL